MVAALLMLAGLSQPATPIHSVTDIAHEFTFYMDGRFAGQYIEGGAHARNWGTLAKLDLTNTNLLILSSGASPCPYTPADLRVINAFVRAGGGLVVMGDFARFREEKVYHLNEVAKAFGAEFTEVPANEPLKRDGSPADLRSYGGKTILLQRESGWHILVRDGDGRAMMAQRSLGKGHVLISSNALRGRNPDSSDPINADLWKPLLQELAKGKPVDPRKGPEGQGPELVEKRDGLTIKCSEYMKPYGDAIMAIYRQERPVMEKVLGVPPSPGMMTSLILLPTGGGGFSSGSEIGLGTWWGDFPQKRYGMIELLGHEGTHSWVLPFAEPMWNEGLATYVGILVGMQMGEKAEAEAMLKSWIDGAKKLDPDMTRFDLTQPGVPHQVGMAKPMWIFEQLRKDRPDIVSRYFQAKRRLIDPSKFRQFTADDSVAVLSVAAGRDLFPWFRSLGISVDRSRTTVPAPR